MTSGLTVNKRIDNKCVIEEESQPQVYLISETNLEPTKVATKQCLHKKMVTKEMTCNVPTCIHTTSVKESMCSLVPVIVCKVGNLANLEKFGGFFTCLFKLPRLFDLCSQ